MQLKLIGVIQSIHDVFIVERWPEQFDSLRKRYRSGAIKPYDLGAKDFWDKLVREQPASTSKVSVKNAAAWATGVHYSTSPKQLRLPPS
jgi:hypothetical protein